MERIVKRIVRLKEDLKGTDLSMVHASLLFILAQEAVGTVIPGMRNEKYVLDNTSVSDMRHLTNDIVQKLRGHNWIRGAWSFE